jgi:hypothetical protein
VTFTLRLQQTADEADKAARKIMSNDGKLTPWQNDDGAPSSPAIWPQTPQRKGRAT